MNDPIELVDTDVAELRDLAGWFELRGDKINAKWLREVADRHEVMAGALRKREASNAG